VSVAAVTLDEVVAAEEGLLGEQRGSGRGLGFSEYVTEGTGTEKRRATLGSAPYRRNCVTCGCEFSVLGLHSTPRCPIHAERVVDEWEPISEWHVDGPHEPRKAGIEAWAELQPGHCRWCGGPREVCHGCVDVKRTLPSNRLLPRTTRDVLLDSYGVRLGLWEAREILIREQRERQKRARRDKGLPSTSTWRAATWQPPRGDRRGRRGRRPWQRYAWQRDAGKVKVKVQRAPVRIQPYGRRRVAPERLHPLHGGGVRVRCSECLRLADRLRWDGVCPPCERAFRDAGCPRAVRYEDWRTKRRRGTAAELATAHHPPSLIDGSNVDWMLASLGPRLTPLSKPARLSPLTPSDLVGLTRDTTSVSFEVRDNGGSGTDTVPPGLPLVPV
jgi:hypothetical protein